MPSYQELVAQAGPARRGLDAVDRPRIAVGIDTSSIAVGALETLKAYSSSYGAETMAGFYALGSPPLGLRR